MVKPPPFQGGDCEFDPRQPHQKRFDKGKEKWYHINMKVNCTKYDLCVCGHERKDHKFICGISAAVKREIEQKCLHCECVKFVLKKD